MTRHELPTRREHLQLVVGYHSAQRCFYGHLYDHSPDRIEQGALLLVERYPERDPTASWQPPISSEEEVTVALNGLFTWMEPYLDLLPHNQTWLRNKLHGEWERRVPHDHARYHWDRSNGCTALNGQDLNDDDQVEGILARRDWANSYERGRW